MSLPEDIEIKIETNFKDQEDSELVKNVLLDLTVPEKLRIIRCILFVSKGNLDTFSQLE